ncbi:hypothetical protein FHG87_007788 [Trinorchestia longiramus]|nr:hypothetical protein FHG87_007788 [Trinorchestia longiramus]
MLDRDNVNSGGWGPAESQQQGQHRVRKSAPFATTGSSNSVKPSGVITNTNDKKDSWGKIFKNRDHFNQMHQF